MKNRTNSCKKWLAVLLSVSMLPTAILQNGSMAYAEEKKQEEAVTAEEALEDREADIVVLASPMYYWGFSGQLKTAFDRLFAVAECFPGYANPHKECALIMAAEGNSADNWKPVLDYYHALLGFLGWQDRGQVLAGGVFEAGAVAGQPVLDQAFRFGASL